MHPFDRMLWKSFENCTLYRQKNILMVGVYPDEANVAVSCTRMYENSFVQQSTVDGWRDIGEYWDLCPASCLYKLTFWCESHQVVVYIRRAEEENKKWCKYQRDIPDKIKNNPNCCVFNTPPELIHRATWNRRSRKLWTFVKHSRKTVLSSFVQVRARDEHR